MREPSPLDYPLVHPAPLITEHVSRIVRQAVFIQFVLQVGPSGGSRDTPRPPIRLEPVHDAELQTTFFDLDEDVTVIG